MPSGWYPRFSVDGAYLAAGNNGVTVYAITPFPFSLAEVASLNGQSPKWLTNSSIIYQRIINGVDRLWSASAAAWTPTDLAHAGYGNFQAGGGLWVGSRNVPLQLELSSGGTIPLGSTPWVDANGRYSYLRGSNRQEVWLSDVGRISSGGNTNADLSVALSGAAWTKLPGYRTYGWRGTTVQDLTVLPAGELYPRVIDTPGGPWLLVQGNVGLYLHPWGNPTTITLTAGAANYPHAIYHVPTGQFFVAWSVNGVLQTQAVVIDTLAPLYAVADGPVISGGASGGGGGTISGGGDTQVVPQQRLAAAAKLAGARTPRAVYPHLKQIKDADAQAATRILYDRVFQVEQLIAGTGGVNAQIAAVQTQQAAAAAAVQTQIQQLSVASTGTSVALGPATPGGGGSDPGDPGGGGGGGGESTDCTGAPGTGHIPAGELTFTRFAQIVCGTGTEWAQYRDPTPDLATRESNAENLIERMIWHLQLGGFNAGRQRNPSTAISKDKLACVILGETRAFDMFRDYDNITATLKVGPGEVFPADLVASAGISD